MQDISYILPEIFLSIMGCFVLLYSAYSTITAEDEKYWNVWLITQFTLLVVIGLLLKSLFLFESPVILFNGEVKLDKLALLLQLFISVTSFLVFIYCREYVKNRYIDFYSEYYVLGLFSILGMLGVVASNSFLSIYLFLELFSLPVYTMIALDKCKVSKGSLEAALKYFVLGAISSGMLLYGISIIYGLTGELQFDLVIEKLNFVQSNDLMLILGLVFIVVGVAFKFGAVPFHMWLPDVYEGSTTSVTMFVASAPKFVAFGLAYRLLFEVLGFAVVQWQELLIFVAVLSLIIGNMVAILQDNIKRLFAYSAIGHVGYILLALMLGTNEGLSAGLLYVFIYVIMTLAAFGCIIYCSRVGFEAENINNYRGLSQRSPLIALIMLIVMFSMAGIPPFLGFYSKFFVINALVTHGHTLLAITAVLFSVIAAFYYLRVVWVMYFQSSEEQDEITDVIDLRYVISINGLFIVFSAFFINYIIKLCSIAFM
tara:strand:- start:7000 stop:8451 length:1452 start_codon:yes stop_codon:yes gene_type:complete